MDNQITYPFIEDYLNNLQVPEDDFLKNLEDECRRDNIPAAVRPTARLLYLLAALHKPERILEIGTAAGYSALTMFYGSGKRANIVTIEKDEERFLVARQNFRQAGAIDSVKPLCGDAEELLEDVDGPFDMAFIDAAKVATRRFFDLVLPKMKQGGLIITDNVLYGGRTAMPGEPEHKHRTGVRAMRDYLSYLTNEPKIYTAILPVGDGVALSFIK